MYIIYALTICLFVVFISVFVIWLCSCGENERVFYVIIPLEADDSVDEVRRLIKEVFYEASISDKNKAYVIIAADTDYREDMHRLCRELGYAEYVLFNEIGSYIIKKENSDEQSTFG